VSEGKYKQFYNTGFQVLPDFLSLEEVNLYKQKSIDICKRQESQFGKDNIALINEENVARSPFLYDDKFKKLFYSDQVLEVVHDILGKYAILSLQNSIIVPPEEHHHQSFYHRDIIYQEFTSSKPLAINIYYCLDDYSKHNGGTCFIERSHLHEKLSRNAVETTPKVPAGSVILFNSMTFHKAGINKSSNIRCGINNMFTLPFVKQQINYPAYFGSPTEDESLNQILGFRSQEFDSVQSFRQYRLNRKINAQ
tara:strand:- start:1837 stop:2592 length:756 start_codon:yes stop_codon:yes gene_type:complete